MCAMIEKLRIWLWGIKKKGAACFGDTQIRPLF
jgi:hypothetical protein